MFFFIGSKILFYVATLVLDTLLVFHAACKTVATKYRLVGLSSLVAPFKYTLQLNLKLTLECRDSRVIFDFYTVTNQNMRVNCK